MYANKAVPCWQVFDEGYVAGTSPAPIRSRSAAAGRGDRAGRHRACRHLADLARQIDVPPDALEQTVQRFNEFAAKGLDPDFGRGQSAYNICLGDPGHKPNAALGPIDVRRTTPPGCSPPTSARAGVITNEHAQVLDEQDG